MSNEFIVRNGLIVTGTSSLSGSLNVDGIIRSNFVAELTSSHAITSSYALTAENVVDGININANVITASAIQVEALYVVTITSSVEYVTGSLTVSGVLYAPGGITGSLYGNASTAYTASYIDGGFY